MERSLSRRKNHLPKKLSKLLTGGMSGDGGSMKRLDRKRLIIDSRIQGLDRRDSRRRFKKYIGGRGLNGKFFSITWLKGCSSSHEDPIGIWRWAFGRNICSLLRMDQHFAFPFSI
jgi:hypothetical protein